MITHHLRWRQKFLLNQEWSRGWVVVVVQSLVVGLDAAWSLFASTLSKMQFTLAQIARTLSRQKLSWANLIHSLVAILIQFPTIKWFQEKNIDTCIQWLSWSANRWLIYIYLWLRSPEMTKESFIPYFSVELRLERTVNGGWKLLCT